MSLHSIYHLNVVLKIKGMSWTIWFISTVFLAIFITILLSMFYKKD